MISIMGKQQNELWTKPRTFHKTTVIIARIAYVILP